MQNVKFGMMDEAVALYKGERLANQLQDDLLALDQGADPLRYRRIYEIGLRWIVADEDNFEAWWEHTVLDVILKEMEVSNEELVRFHENFVRAAQQQLLTA